MAGRSRELGPQAGQGDQAEVDAQVAQADAEDRSAREGAIAQGIPPADEPLEPSNVNTLAEVADRTIAALDGGQTDIPPTQRISEATEQLPPDLAAKLAALSEMAILPIVEEAAEYKFDVRTDLQTNDGLMEVTGILDAMGRDKALIKAVQGPSDSPAQPADEGEPEAPAGPEEE